LDTIVAPDSAGVPVVGVALPQGGRPTDEQAADWLRGYAERRDRGDRERIILAHLDLADRLAARCRGRPNTTPDDLRQTARVGLIGAVDRYDPTRGTPFQPYAIASIIGALKRHLRDATWSVRVPRTIKQHALALLGARERLTQRGDRWPAIAELATSLGITHDEATRAIRAAQNRTALSLDIPVVDGEDGVPLAALLPDPEPTVAPEDLVVLPGLVAALPAAERSAVRPVLLPGPQAARDRRGAGLLADAGVPPAAPGAGAPARPARRDRRVRIQQGYGRWRRRRRPGRPALGERSWRARRRPRRRRAPRCRHPPS
jgi:RNA polymerase sigma-B factor